MKHLRQHSSPQDSGILILSLAATIKDNQDLVNFASAFIRGSVSAAGMMVDAIDEHPVKLKSPLTTLLLLLTSCSTQATLLLLNLSSRTC